MTDPNYLIHAKALGKLVKMYDDAVADQTALELISAALYDQIATGLQPSWAVLQVLNPYTSQIASAISAGAVAVQNLVISMVSSYLQSQVFLATLVPALLTGTTAKAALDAWKDDFDTDGKTFDTAAATGFAHFFALATWNMAAPFPTMGAPSAYPDATYCVSAVV